MLFHLLKPLNHQESYLYRITLTVGKADNLVLGTVINILIFINFRVDSGTVQYNDGGYLALAV